MRNGAMRNEAMPCGEMMFSEMMPCGEVMRKSAGRFLTLQTRTRRAALISAPRITTSAESQNQSSKTATAPSEP